jgi:hypothetical protein
MRIAYLTTQYPKVSHTFIRRELRELENRGHFVLRLAIRPADSAIVDPADLEESEKTIHCLAQPWRRLLSGQLRTVFTRPLHCSRAAMMALRMGRRSERGLLRHLAYFAEAAWLVAKRWAYCRSYQPSQSPDRAARHHASFVRNQSTVAASPSSNEVRGPHPSAASFEPSMA